MCLRPLKKVLVSVSALAISACGGGGSGTDSVSGGAPLPPNRAPIVVFDVPEFAFEKGTLRFDATASYDPDEDTGLTIVIEQISGTPATFLYSPGQENTGYDVWAAPEFDGVTSESLTFRVTASDYQGLSSSRDFSIRVEADDLAGQPVARYTDELELVVGNSGSHSPGSAPDEVMAFRHNSAGQSELVWLGGNHRQFGTDIVLQDMSGPLGNATFDKIEHIQYSSFYFNLSPAPSTEFTVVEPDRNRIRWFYREGERDENKDFIYIESTQMDIESPCFIHRRLSTGEDFVWVAHESGGVSLVKIDPIRVEGQLAKSFTYSTILKTAEDRKLCHIHPTVIDEAIIPPEKNGQFELYQPALAIDVENNDLVVLGDPREGGDRYGEITSIPLQTETTETLKVIDVIARGEPSRTPRYMLVLLSDGLEDGIHRLVYIKQGPFGKITQDTFRYEGPPPIGLHLGPMGGGQAGGQFSLDIAITTSGDFGVFFDTTGGGISEPPSFAEPVTFAIAPGGTDAVSLDFDQDTSQQRLLINYPDTKTLRVYQID